MANATTYIVLRRNESSGLRAIEPEGAWIIHEEAVNAGNPQQAIRQALAGKPAVEMGTYVAVPARSWKPVQVEAVQTTVLKLT